MKENIESVIGGAFIGAIVGIFVAFTNCLCFGGKASSIEPIIMICVVIGAVIMIIINLKIQEEDRERAEERQREQLENQRLNKINNDYQNWKNNMTNNANSIINNVQNCNDTFDYFATISSIKSQYKKYPSYKNSMNKIEELEPKFKQQYDAYYNQVNKWIIEKLKYKFLYNITEETGPVNSKISAIAIKVYYEYIDQVDTNQKYIDSLYNFAEMSFTNSILLSFEQYGEADLLLLDSNEFDYYDNNIVSIYDSINDRLNRLRNSEGNINVVTDILTYDLLKDIAIVLWYYAMKKPFDVNKFDNAKDLYNKYLNYNTNKELSINAEVLIATIYSKNQLGGENLIRQDWKFIDKWIEYKVGEGEDDACCMLASALAWLDLYNIEVDVLRKLVQLGVDLNEEIQDRLNFLENGGTENIFIYDVPDENYFYYDNGSMNWKQKEIDLFFRKAAMKKKAINYSLALDNWTKTLPLQKGQKIQNEELHKGLEDMIEDFDGEVSIEKTNAKAINLQNIIFENAILFRFDSVRNKCVSMLFSCEKYGRNLNLNIVTLFTPNKEDSYDDMKQYASAIKTNTYIDSFRESILQTLDEVLKEKQSIYEEDDIEKKQMKFID